MSGPDPVGSAAEEAARLFAAVEDWARNRSGLLDPERQDPERQDTERPNSDRGLGAGSTCGACPLCSGIALLREVKPETVEHLLDAAASVVAALRSVGPTAAPQGVSRPSGVEHIDVREG